MENEQLSFRVLYWRSSYLYRSYIDEFKAALSQQ